jgi:hypothetical protein
MVLALASASMSLAYPVSSYPNARVRCAGAGSLPADCVVCLEAFRESETASRLPCAHVFHAGCVVTWLERVCRDLGLDCAVLYCIAEQASALSMCGIGIGRSSPILSVRFLWARFHSTAFRQNVHDYANLQMC